MLLQAHDLGFAHPGHTLAQGQARADKEARMMEALTQGQSTLELMNLTSFRQA